MEMFRLLPLDHLIIEEYQSVGFPSVLHEWDGQVFKHPGHAALISRAVVSHDESCCLSLDFFDFFLCLSGGVDPKLLNCILMMSELKRGMLFFCNVRGIVSSFFEGKPMVELAFREILLI